MLHIIDEKLSNNIRVLIDPEATARTASIGMAFAIGALHESAAENGISHMIEHNMFCGTAEHSIVDIQDRAADIGAEMNAYTSADETNYYLTAMAENSGEMIDLLADIVTRSIFPIESFETEKNAILQEIKMRDDNPHIAGADMMRRIIYPGQSAGQNAIGPASNVSAIGRDQMISYFKENCNTGSMIVTVAGGVNPSEILSKLEDRLSSVPIGIQSMYETPIVGDPSYAHVSRADMDQTLAILSYPAFADFDRKSPVLRVAGRILGNGMGSHLFKETRTKRGLVYDIGAHTIANVSHGSMQINFGCEEGNVSETVNVVRETLEAFTSKITEDELCRAKKKFSTVVALFNESAENRMRDNLSYTILRGKPVSPEEEIAEINAVTLQDIKNVFPNIITQTPFVVTVGRRDMHGTFAACGL